MAHSQQIASSALLWLFALMPKKPAQPQDKYIVRFPEGMREQIAEAARLAGRSMNAEIVLRLARSLDPDLSPEAEEERTERFKEEFSRIYDRLAELEMALSRAQGITSKKR